MKDDRTLGETAQDFSSRRKSEVIGKGLAEKDRFISPCCWDRVNRLQVAVHRNITVPLPCSTDEWQGKINNKQKGVGDAPLSSKANK